MTYIFKVTSLEMWTSRKRLIFAIEMGPLRKSYSVTRASISRSKLQIFTKLFLQICLHLYGNRRRVAFVKLRLKIPNEIESRSSCDNVFHRTGAE